MFVYFREDANIQGFNFASGKVYPARLYIQPARIVKGALDFGDAELTIDTNIPDEYFDGNYTVTIIVNTEHMADTLAEQFYILDCDNEDDAFDVGVTLEMNEVVKQEMMDRMERPDLELYDDWTRG